MIASYLSQASIEIFLYFSVVTHLFLSEREIIVFHNSMDGLLNTWYLRSSKLIARDTEVEKICSSGFNIEVEWVNNYNELCEKGDDDGVMPRVLQDCSERAQTEIRGWMFEGWIGVRYS